MSAMAAVSLISGIVQLAPSLAKIFKGSESSVEVAELAAKVARNVTGADSNEDALKSLASDPAMLVEYEKALREHELALQTLVAEDRKSARLRDAEFVRGNTRNYRADILVAVSVVIIFAIGATVIFSPNLNEYAKGSLTTILGVFLNMLTNVFTFEFGATRKSEESNQKLIDDYISIPTTSIR